MTSYHNSLSHPNPIRKRTFYQSQNKIGLPYPNYGLDKDTDELPILCHCYMEPNYTFYVSHEKDVPTLYRNGCFGYSNLTKRGPSSMLNHSFEKSAYYVKMKSRINDQNDQIDSGDEGDRDDDDRQNETINGDESPSPSPNLRSKHKEGIPNGNGNGKVDIASATTNGHDETIDAESESSCVPVPETEKLILLPEEVIFLSFAVGCLTIQCTSSSDTLSYQEVWKLLSQHNPEFPAKYAVYHYFRSKHWVPKGGISFGGDYVLYQMGPEFYHSTYIVHIIGLPSRPRLTWTELYSRQRLASTSKKCALICEVNIPDDFIPETSSPNSIFDISIQETLIRRWDPMTRI